MQLLIPSQRVIFLGALEKPERIIEIKSEYEIRRASICQNITPNYLRPVMESPEIIDDLYGVILFVMP